MTEVGAITITDSNSGTGGSAGAYSGFDVDALFLDMDGDYTILGDQVYASSFLFGAGALRAGSAPASNTAGALNGSVDNSTVDEGFATLGAVDAVFFSTGSISLGDGGSLTANFDPVVAVGASLFIITAEVGTGAGEAISALIRVSDTPATIPRPSSMLMLVGGLGLGGLVTRRRKRKS